MARTFTILPASLPDIIRSVVQQVSTNLSTDSDYSTDIPQVTFKHGSWTVIHNELKSDDMGTSTKNVKYPLVALVHPYNERTIDSLSSDIECQILIACRSTATKKAQERTDESYTAILNPIYAELISCLADSYYLLGFNEGRIEHVKTDLHHFGRQAPDGPDGYYIPDFVDAILLTGVKLKLNLQSCAYPQPPCYYTPCENGLEIRVLDVIKTVVISGTGTNTLSVTVTEKTFTDNSGALPAPWTAQVDFASGPTVDVAEDVAATKNVSALQDGFYIGTITHGSAYVKFYYLVVSGTVAKHTSLISQTITYDLGCEYYAGYPVTVGITYSVAKVDGQNNILNGYTLDAFGVEDIVEDHEVSPVASITQSTEISTNHHVNTNYTIDQMIDYGGQTPLTCRSILRTQCAS